MSGTESRSLLPPPQCHSQILRRLPYMERLFPNEKFTLEVLHMKTILYENQRGFLFKNGRYIKMLMPGKYHTFGSSTIEIQNLETRSLSSFCPI